MTDTPRRWDRRADETPKSYAAFLAYVALGARRSVREAARQHCVIWAEKYDGEALAPLVGSAQVGES